MAMFIFAIVLIYYDNKNKSYAIAAILLLIVLALVSDNAVKVLDYYPNQAEYNLLAI